MGFQTAYTLPIFGAIGYLFGTNGGQDLINHYVKPHLWPGIRDFEYSYEETPLMYWVWTPALCFSYLISVYLLKFYMQDKKPWDLHYFRILHNSFLCFGSFMVVIGVTGELYKTYKMGGFEALVCDSNGYQIKTSLYNWYYVFYLSKFYEFVDTYILILRKKPVIFLHLFHHFITAFLAFLGLWDRAVIQWPIITFNASVHVFMYYYYLAVSLGSDVWWKKYLTTMQIVQFCLDILSGIPFHYYLLVLGKQCSGTEAVINFEHFILFCFLLLFINFYRKSYSPDAASPPQKKKVH